MMSITEVVAQAAVALDHVEPGWWNRVDTGKLNMPHACNCVLGQLYGSFAVGLKRLVDTGLDFYLANAFAALIPESVWQQEIEARRNSPPRDPSDPHDGEEVPQMEEELAIA